MASLKRGTIVFASASASSSLFKNLATIIGNTAQPYSTIVENSMVASPDNAAAFAALVRTALESLTGLGAMANVSVVGDAAVLGSNTYLRLTIIGITNATSMDIQTSGVSDESRIFPLIDYAPPPVGGGTTTGSTGGTTGTGTTGGGTTGGTTGGSTGGAPAGAIPAATEPLSQQAIVAIIIGAALLLTR